MFLWAIKELLMNYERLFLLSLLITLIVEVPVVFLIGHYIYKISEKWNIIFSGIISSVLTLPYFWFILPVFISNRTTYIIIGESTIIFVEALIYFKILKLKFSQAFLVSLIANIASILIGLILM